MRRGAAAAVLTAGLVALLAAPADAATSASGTQAVTGAPSTGLTATFPADYAFASLAPGTTATSSEQLVNVKSDASWGVQVTGDDAAGLMRRWNGAAYVAGSLASGLKWARTSLGGTPEGAPVWTTLSTVAATVATTQPATAAAGVDVGVSYRQPVAYSDPTVGADTYRTAVTLTAAQGF